MASANPIGYGAPHNMADIDPKLAKPKGKSAPLPLPPQTVLVLQGGGALGSFQAGVFEALEAEAESSSDESGTAKSGNGDREAGRKA